MVKNCERCGASFSDETNFCVNCGIKLTEQKDVYTNPYYRQAKREIMLDITKALIDEEKGIKSGKGKDFKRQKEFQNMKRLYKNFPPELKQLFELITTISNRDEAGKLIEMLMNFIQTQNKKMLLIFMEELAKNLPNNKFVWVNLASMYIDEDDLVKAAICGERIVKIDPNDAAEWAKLGGLYSFQTKFDDSIRCFKKTLELNPNDYHVIKTLSMVYEFNNDLENALKLTKQYLDKYPNDKDQQKRLKDLMSGKSALSEVGKRIKESKDKG
ncbi:MAG: hypothetical protein ACFFGP_00875 [Promethearchaeota archaeon]